jgi:hypothetical protein
MQEQDETNDTFSQIVLKLISNFSCSERRQKGLHAAALELVKPSRLVESGWSQRI